MLYNQSMNKYKTREEQIAELEKEARRGCLTAAVCAESMRHGGPPIASVSCPCERGGQGNGER